MLFKLTNINIVRSLFLIFSLNNVFLNYAVLGREYENLQDIEYAKSANSTLENIKPKYILGAGDQLRINFLGLEEIFESEYYIDPDGYIYLPEINHYKASGKTLSELKLELENVYEEFIKEPRIEISIAHYRPVNYYIKGEIKTPGLYTIPVIMDEKRFYFPRLYQALRLGEGLKNNADVTNIEIIRKNSNDQGGGEIKTNINLLKLIFEGNQDFNINIYDGDIITIKKANKPIKEQILAVNRTNISPSKINITITGNALNPGVYTLKRGSSLIQAIASSGGKKLYSGNVEFIRFNDDGTTTKNVFRYNSKAEINSKNNPILMDGDLINIKRTLLGGGAELARDVITPIITFKGLTAIFSD